MSHPLHPALVHFPIALLATTSLWDGAGLLIHGVDWPEVARYNLALGLVLAVPALASGLWELRRLPDTPAIARSAMAHLTLVSSALALYLTSFILRVKQPEANAALVVALLGLACLVVGGWFGAQLVYRHGIAVHPAPGAELAENTVQPPGTARASS